MGLSDRDYARDDSRSGFQLALPQSGVGLLLLANVVLYVVDILLEGRLAERLALHANLITHPWNCWQLVTSAFVHNPHSIWHILGNMFALWIFGNDVERLYGRAEFLRIYFVAAVVAGLAWVVSQNWLVPYPAETMIGASGAVTCIWVLFALHFPTRMILFWGLFPMPMWLFGFINILPDLQGFLASLNGKISTTAFEAHLGGAATALVYRKLGWNFGRWLPRGGSITAPRFGTVGRPKLKLHQPTTDAPADLDSEVDRLLAKINATGIDSLTPAEKKTLERASARYQKRRP
jgi:membrane associated rhomboid family serine protease